jgi:hypothetical protein
MWKKDGRTEIPQLLIADPPRVRETGRGNTRCIPSCLSRNNNRFHQAMMHAASLIASVQTGPGCFFVGGLAGRGRAGRDGRLTDDRLILLHFARASRRTKPYPARYEPLFVPRYIAWKEEH